MSIISNYPSCRSFSYFLVFYTNPDPNEEELSGAHLIQVWHQDPTPHKHLHSLLCYSTLFIMQTNNKEPASFPLLFFSPFLLFLILI